ncbi:DNA polymerase III subunit delta [Enterococcus sp. LJL98]
MDVQKALQQINNQKLSNIYLVLGTEAFLQEQVRKAFIERLSIEENDLNFSQFDLSETPVSHLLAEVESSPFFGDYRLVFAEHPFFLTSEKPRNAPDNDLEPLLTYLQNPLETTILVFWVNYEKMDERKKITKQLKKAASLIDVQPLKEGEVRRYIQQTIANDHLEFSREAFDLFFFLTDASLSKAMHELSKIRLFAEPGSKISKEMVAALVPRSLEQNVFDLTNRVLEGRAQEALQLYEELQVQGEETIKINAILLSQIRLLLQVRFLQNIGYQQGAMGETLRIHPYRIRLAMQQARKFEVKQLAHLYDELIENDFKIKTGQMDKELLFQLFILKTSENVRK